MMSSKTPDFPREGLVSDKESLTNAEALVCPIGYGGGNKTFSSKDTDDGIFFNTDQARDKDILKSFLSRTGDRRGSAPDLNESGNTSVIDLSWDDTEMISKKRKISKTPQKGRTEDVYVTEEDDYRLRLKMVQVTKELKGMTEKAVRKCRDKNTTKSDMTEMINNLNAKLSQITTDTMISALMRKINVKTDDRKTGGICLKCGDELGATREIRELLTLEHDNDDELRNLLPNEWPQFLLTKTRILDECIGIDTIGEDVDVVIITDGELNKDHLVKNILGMYPALQVAVNQEMVQTGSLVYAETSCQVLGDTNLCPSKPSTKIIYVTGGNNTSKDSNNLLTILNKVKNINKIRGCNRKLLIVQTGTEYTYLRKITEYVFRNEKEIEQISIIKAVHGRGVIKPVNSNFRTEAMEVKLKKNDTYQDVVRKMKKTVDPSKFGVKILAVSETKKGSIKIKINTKNDNSDGRLKFMEELGKADEGIEAITEVVNTKEILIRDLKEDDTIEEITEAIIEIIKEKPKMEIYLSPKGINNTRFAVVKMPAKYASTLLESSRIKVGWSRCRIEERLRPPKCYQCHSFGHFADACPNPEKRDVLKGRCLKCGEEGHMSRECTSAKLWCYGCSVDGHRAGTWACPKYKSLIQELKGKTRISRQTSVLSNATKENPHGEDVNIDVESNRLKNRK